MTNQDAARPDVGSGAKHRLSSQPETQPGYLNLKGLAAYCSVSERCLRDWLNHPKHPIPHYRMGNCGRVLVKVDEFNRWMQQWRTEGSMKPRIDEIINDLMAKMRGERPPRRVRRQNKRASGRSKPGKARP